jgi:hypothetical protein
MIKRYAKDFSRRFAGIRVPGREVVSGLFSSKKLKNNENSTSN